MVHSLKVLNCTVKCGKVTMGHMIFLLVLSGVVLNLVESSVNTTVEQKLREDTDLSQFYDLLIANNVANFTLQNRQLTLFAPTNEAFQRYHGRQDDLILYHMINLAKTVDQFGSSMSSELEGNPPLWVNIRKGSNRDDIYINNAKLLYQRSNYVAMNKEKKQVLHVIDNVLEPVLPSQTTTSPVYNPNAYQFLNQSESLDIGHHRLRTFRQKVTENKKEEIFNNDGKYTFFVPVDEGFKPTNRAEMLDEKVIDGHVVPNHVLFTAATYHETPYETLAFGDNLKVTVYFTTEADPAAGKPSRVYINSNTLVGDSKLQAGVVLAEVVKANIPVRNGVIHLIQRPLMVVDTTITQFLEGSRFLDQNPKNQKDEGPLSKFYEAIMDTEVGVQFITSIKRMRDVTLFAPSNAAWQDENVRNVIRNPDKMRDILNLHLVRDQRLSTEKIKQNNVNMIYQVPTAADRKNLYFNIVNRGNEEVLTVEGGGVNATCVQANIAATNGIIHIIDHVLGVPQTTVLEKLKNDPMLNDTYFLGQRENFNAKLNDPTKKFTYFVPRDKAWRKSEINFPSTLKKLFMPEFSYHAVRLLERHLVIADIPYTMEQMKKSADENNEIVLPTYRDNLRIRIEEKDKSFTIIWRNEKIHVFRPDVECTNGVIHVIDSPLLLEDDIRIPSSTAGIALPLVANLVMIFAVKWLLL